MGGGEEGGGRGLSKERSAPQSSHLLLPVALACRSPGARPDPFARRRASPQRRVRRLQEPHGAAPQLRGGQARRVDLLGLQERQRPPTAQLRPTLRLHTRRHRGVGAAGGRQAGAGGQGRRRCQSAFHVPLPDRIAAAQGRPRVRSARAEGAARATSGRCAAVLNVLTS